MKFCKDCKFFIPNTSVIEEDRVRFGLCEREPYTRTDLVTGVSKNLHAPCFKQRDVGGLLAVVLSRCGSQGRFWEPLQSFVCDPETDEFLCKTEPK